MAVIEFPSGNKREDGLAVKAVSDNTVLIETETAFITIKVGEDIDETIAALQLARQVTQE